MVKLIVNVVHDTGDVPTSLNWKIEGYTKDLYIDVYVDNILYTSGKGDLSGKIDTEKTLITAKEKADVQNIYTYIVEKCPNTKVLGEFYIDGIVFSFRRRV